MASVLLCQGTALQLPLKDASVHTVCTSPPFYGLRDYQTGAWEGGDPSCAHSPTDTPQRRGIDQSTLGGGKATTGHQREGYRGACPRCGAVRVDAQLGLEASPDLYIAAMVQVFREVKRVLHPMGTCWVNMGDSYANSGQTGLNSYSATSTLGPQRDGLTPQNAAWQRSRPRQTLPPGLPPKNLLGMPWRLAFALQNDGWVLRSAITWCKSACMPESVTDRPTSATEMVFLFAKQPHYFYDAEASKERVGESTRRTTEFRRASAYTNHLADKVSNHAPRPAGDASEGPDSLSGRNARNYWVLGPEPLQGFQHYATFPTALVRRCLLAGAPTAVCNQCGSPHRRVVERQRLLDGHLPVTGAFCRPEEPYRVPNGIGHYRYTTQTTDHGFEATCRCDAGIGKAVILDPFCGSGTTLLVARELGHHAVGVDLSYHYLQAIARERLGLSALHAWQHGQTPQAVSYADLPLFGCAP